MLRGCYGNLIFAIIARILCGNHLKHQRRTAYFKHFCVAMLAASINGVSFVYSNAKYTSLYLCITSKQACSNNSNEGRRNLDERARKLFHSQIIVNNVPHKSTRSDSQHTKRYTNEMLMSNSYLEFKGNRRTFLCVQTE